MADIAAFRIALTIATISAEADSFSISPKSATATSDTPQLTTAMAIADPIRNSSRKPNRRQKWPEVSNQLRLMIATGPTFSSLATVELISILTPMKQPTAT